MPRNASELRRVRERVVREYLPTWCASHWRPHPLDPKAFVKPDWSFLTPGLAYWFLVAIDNGVVKVIQGDFSRGSSWSEGVFEQAGSKDDSPRGTKLRIESFFEIAAAGMLVLRYGWPVERLAFQPKGLALDFLAYADDGWPDSEVVIAGEAKRLQRDALALSASLDVCVKRGPHEEADCTERQNHHRKYIGLLKFRPRILWIVGPEAFAADPDLVFGVEGTRSGIVRLRHTDASELTFSSP